MRRQAAYPAPRYIDPDDVRLVQIIKEVSQPQRRAVNVLGVPFDGAVLGRKGAVEGPRAIREAMAGFSNYNVELGIGLGGARIFDLGDVIPGRTEVEAAHREIEEEVSRSLLRGSLLAILGGDNSVSLPALRASAKKFRKLGLVVVDSHLDLRGKIGGKPTSGSSYGLAVATVDGLDARRVVEIGTHGFLNSEAYSEKAKGLGIEIMPASEAARLGPASAAKEAYDVASDGAEAVYLSIDLDAIGIGEVSGVSAPSAGGLSAMEVCDIAYRLASRPKVNCSDIVELAPPLDPTGRSSRVAATVLTYLFAGFASRTK